MKIKAFLVSLLMLSVACKSIDIVDGEIPAEHLDEVSQYTGVYSGSFNGMSADLEVKLVGNKLELDFLTPLYDDYIRIACEANVGDLLRVSASGSKDNYEITGGEFQLEHGCEFIGDRLLVSIFEKDNQTRFLVRILSHYSINQNCRYEPPPPAGSGRRVCDPPGPVYARGVLVKN